MVNEDRVKAYEQLEGTALELQKTNNKLQSETANMKKRYGVLSETIEALEVKCEDYQQEIEELRVERLKLQREVAMTFPAGEEENPGEPQQLNIHGHDKNTLESDIEALNERISNLRGQHSMEKWRREELELELTELLRENQQLEGEMQQFARRKWQSDESILDKSVDSASGDITDLKYDKKAVEDESYVLLEIDPLVRHTSESSDQSGVEVLSLPEEAKSPSSNSASFLSELDSQYRELVYKYDSLLNKCRKEGVLDDLPPLPTVQRAIQVCTDQAEERSCGHQASCQKHGEYKKLFAEIYSKLEESKNFKSNKGEEN